MINAQGSDWMSYEVSYVFLFCLQDHMERGRRALPSRVTWKAQSLLGSKTTLLHLGQGAEDEA